MLGRTAAATVTAAAGTVVAAPTATNAAQQFFDQRPEPKPLVQASLSGKKAVSNSHELREMHRAGGYEYANYERRNWAEIMSQLSNVSLQNN